MENKWTKIEQLLTNLIKTSRRPDYLEHALTTRDWLIKLYPKATKEMKLAAFAHDIERCFFEKMIPVEQEDYLPYKNRHAFRCADILAGIMLGLDFPEETIKKVHYLVRLHEVGGDFEADLIRDADSLSFMSNNLAGYFAKDGEERTIAKIKFMYGRASAKAKEFIQHIEYPTELKGVVVKALQ
jgi:hypothetical protein